MLNFRTLKKDYSPAILKEGKAQYDKGAVISARIVNLNSQSIRLNCRVSGSFDNTYECELEIDRHESMTIDSNCDCSYHYDCQHLAAVLFYLEDKLDSIVVAYSQETDIGKSKEVDETEKAVLLETIKEAETKERERVEKICEKELLDEYITASKVLGQSPFFLPDEHLEPDKAELAIVFSILPQQLEEGSSIEIQLSLRLPFRSKPLNILNIKEFLDAVRYAEPLYIGNKRYFFTLKSFDTIGAEVLKMIMIFARFNDPRGEKNPRTAQFTSEIFGAVLAKAHEMSKEEELARASRPIEKSMKQSIPCLYFESLEQPLHFSPTPAMLRVGLEYFDASAPKILLRPELVLGNQLITVLEEATLFECAKPGLIHDNTYYRFQPQIKRKHLRNLTVLRSVTIPEPLFGAFAENSIPELVRFAEVANREILDRFVSIPFTGQLRGECHINYLNGELEATLYFIYDDVKVPAASSQLTISDVTAFVDKEGILARNLTQEQKIIESLFQGFIYEPPIGAYVAKTDKKVVEFMTEIIPQYQHQIEFHCPENLLEQFIYDETTFELNLSESNRIDLYQVDLKVHGHLCGVTIDLLWECLGSKRTFIELSRKKYRKDKENEEFLGGPNKILVLNLEKLAPVVQIFDEIGINVLDDHVELRPLWSLANIDPLHFENLPIKFTMSKKLQVIQQQMLGITSMDQKPIPKIIQADLRSYQQEGAHWLERLRSMHLNGILADDMGLGKTLQAIIAITQHVEDNPKSVSMVVCPTSLVYNWVEEVGKFNPKLKILAVDGTPAQRKKLIDGIKKHHVVVTSYSLLQKDIEHYKNVSFAYTILDEAQHIKNRGTRNAKSVKMIQASHKLILTGTPIENSLDELWSLFDFLMPGLLSTYDRFIEKYVRNNNPSGGNCLDSLRAKVTPFILRRMKKDVLEELPPVAELTYHCHLSEIQKELYRSYAKSAREELSQLVKKEGFDRVQIHVLATLTRLKQICCHPAIFAKEKPELGDSSKYDMLIELLQTLIEGRHKTVIFSQYTRMLHIMRDDLANRGIEFSYLDGSSKNRLSIVKEFNENESIPVFLISLKAGGSGLNLTSADTVIHYDMWWNPAVENQATDRVHRMGQKRSVSSLKLVTLDTIEEKIIELQNRKRGLVKNIISCEEEALSKLTWEEVLELLQT